MIDYKNITHNYDKLLRADNGNVCSDSGGIMEKMVTKNELRFFIIIYK